MEESGSSDLMSVNPLVVVGLGTLLGATGVITFNVIRARRESNRIARREQLMALARRAGLEYVGDRPRQEDIDAAAWFRAGERNVTADGFLQGQDRNGRYWVARRKVMGLTHEVVGFQIRGDLNVGQAYIEPTVAAASGGDSSWAKRLLSKSTPAPARVDRWTVYRQAAPQQVADEGARNAVDRWVTRLVARGKTEGRMPVGIEVRDGLGWVFSIRPLEGARMTDFLDCALDLRGAVLQEVQRRPATISVPVNTVTGEADRKARESTVPMFAVDAAEGADLGEESKTVVLSAADLLREAPTPPTGKRRSKKFYIPEPEEDVEVIGTWGR
jgi:hypothetical protein